MGIREAVRLCLRLITHHIGLGGDAHADVTSKRAGFISAKSYNEHQSLFKQRTHLGTNVDILKLEPGYYEGSSLINHPLTGSGVSTRISEIDVKFGRDGRKQIKLVDSFDGSMWYLAVHTNGVADDRQPQWAKVRQHTILWQGNSELASPVTLAHPIISSSGAFNYYEIEFKFINSANTTSVGVIKADALSGSLNSTSNIGEGGSGGITTYEAIAVLTATTAVLTNNLGINIYPNANDANDARIRVNNDSKIKVLEIRGVR